MKSLSLNSIFPFWVNWPLGGTVKTAETKILDNTTHKSLGNSLVSMFPKKLLSTGNYPGSLGMGGEEGQGVVGAVLAL